MKFQQIPYQRPNMEQAGAKLSALSDQVRHAADGEALLAAYQSYVVLSDEVETAATVASIRHSVDTRDAFYDAENDYYDAQTPVFQDKTLTFFRALLASPYREALENQYGKMLTNLLEIHVKSSDNRLVKLQQEENALVSRYDKLYASARIPFQGKELTVSQLAPFKQSTDRVERKEAFEAEGRFFDGHQDELDELYDQLVKSRTAQAGLLGLRSFTPLGDIRMQRNGYTRQDIQAYRAAVVDGIVPVARKLKELQARRIGVKELAFYDDPLSFADGNPTPTGTPEEILQAGRQMYRSLSPETAEFIDFMMDGDLFDVLSKPGKAPGGYCTYIPQTRSPFIFSNFNGTAGDVDVLTHEAGHAFAAYLAAKTDLPPQLRSPGLESCEIHSMSMEFLTSDYHHLFFGPQTEKYEFTHAEDAMIFMPYGCQVDEFQEIIYDEPGLSPAQRNALWLELEKKYRPWNRFEALPFYSRGAGWQRQLHIYRYPFYYIDYVLAQAVSLFFFLAHREDPKDAWQRYMRMTEKAGTETYVGLIHTAGFESPFLPGVMGKIGDSLETYLMQHSRAWG